MGAKPNRAGKLFGNNETQRVIGSRRSRLPDVAARHALDARWTVYRVRKPRAKASRLPANTPTGDSSRTACSSTPLRASAHPGRQRRAAIRHSTRAPRTRCLLDVFCARDSRRTSERRCFSAARSRRRPLQRGRSAGSRLARDCRVEQLKPSPVPSRALHERAGTRTVSSSLAPLLRGLTGTRALGIRAHVVRDLPPNRIRRSRAQAVPLRLRGRLDGVERKR